MIIAAWEGNGAIDYGKGSDLVALKYEEDYFIEVIEKSGFDINQCKLQFINEMEMNAIYIEASRI
ncbi:MAG: hypothetical protein KJP15_09360 [Gammaproteobacteria bacterium]|nr:hypothetical protein [Gammaproteobacteria bacterium]